VFVYPIHSVPAKPANPMTTRTVKLRHLSSGTEFTLNGRKYRKTMGAVEDKFECDPFLGGKFQTATPLKELISRDTMVEVEA